MEYWLSLSPRLGAGVAITCALISLGQPGTAGKPETKAVERIRSLLGKVLDEDADPIALAAEIEVAKLQIQALVPEPISG